MFAQIRPTLVIFVSLSILTGIVYPLAVTGVAQVTMPEQAGGSLLVKAERRIGSHLIGQPFSQAKYFWGRPSATGPVPYNAGSSSGSNLGPLHPDLAKAVAERVAALRAADPDHRQPVPVDLVTASGSGLDPHISPAAAAYQMLRVAKARGIDLEKVKTVVAVHTAGRQLSVLGEPRVNVLELNLALDELK